MKQRNFSVLTQCLLAIVMCITSTHTMLGNSSHYKAIQKKSNVKKALGAKKKNQTSTQQDTTLAALAGARQQTVSAIFTTYKSLTHNARLNIIEKIQQADQQAKNLSPTALKLLTNTKEGAIYKHTLLMNQAASYGSQGNNESYKNLHELVKVTGTAEAYKMLIASTNESYKWLGMTYTPQSDLQKAIDACSYEGYKGLDGLSILEEKLRNPSLSSSEKLTLSAIHKELSNQIEKAATEKIKYHSTYITVNTEGYEKYSQDYFNNENTKQVLKLSENVTQELGTFLQSTLGLSEHEMLAALSQNTTHAEGIRATTSAALSNVNSKLTEHFSGVDLESLHPFTGNAQLETGNSAVNDKLRDAIKHLYENMPLTAQGISMAIQCAGGAENSGNSHQSILQEQHGSDLSRMAAIEYVLKNPATPETEKAKLLNEYNTIAKNIQESLLAYANENRGGMAKDDVYLDLNKFSELYDEHQKNNPDHYGEELLNSYYAHEQTMLEREAQRAAIENSQTNK